MRGQVALIGGSDAELDAVLAGAELDPGFPDFVAWCEARGLPLSIVSDGVDAFIAQILARHGLDRLPVTANRLTGAAGRRGLEHPPRPVDCESGAGVCKCAAAATDDSDIVVFVGDGRSDFCVATRADILFAKGALAAYATAQGKAYYSFDTFHDVRHALAQLAADGAAMPGDAALV
jgi:2-hydroxy-3-keto-5-methylthiopentenyl-1-phosphate phosphatase